MIDSTSPLDRASRTASVPDEAASPGTARVLRIRDSLQTNKAAELDAARARERDLERVAEEASAALGRAASEVRAALKVEPLRG